MIDPLTRMLFNLDRLRQGETGEPLKEPLIAYRMEMPDGRGPFNSKVTGREGNREIFMTLVQQNEGWPGWIFVTEPKAKCERMGVTENAFYKAHGNAAYGCNSIQSINTWFPRPSRELLCPLGAKIVAYHLPVGSPVIELDVAGEIIFNPKDASKVEHLPLFSTLEGKS